LIVNNCSYLIEKITFPWIHKYCIKKYNDRNICEYDARYQLYSLGCSEKIINYLLKNKYYYCLDKLIFCVKSEYNKKDIIYLLPLYNDIVKNNITISSELEVLFNFKYF
jgi:hypothetical protein